MTNGDYRMEQLLGNKLQNKNRREYDCNDWLENCYCKPQYESIYSRVQSTFVLNERSNYVKEQFSKLTNEKRNDNNMRMPEIKNYTYNEKIGLTTIEWCDGTKTTARAENPECADRFTGFMTAYAKRAAGNTSYINSLFDKWAIKKPIKDKIAEEKRIAQETENKRIAEKHRAKREKYIIRKMALQRKREYEAKKLANEKYNIPMDED